MKLKQDHQITFQGSTVFRIRESGVADLSYLNELKIVGAPSNLIGKKVRLTFSQERLQPVNTTITLRQCEKGFQASPFTAREGLFTCTPCPAQQYNVISGGKCHDCPAVGAICLGRNDMYVLPGYYGHINKMLAKHMAKSLSLNALVVIVVHV